MNEESHNPNREDNIEPELEARIIALVLGEASDFETEELHRLIAQRPELAAFKQRMESMHGLLLQAGAGEFEAPSGEWKLPSNKRNAVLAAIRGEATIPAAIQSENPAVTQGMSARRRWRWKLAATLGGACLAGFIGVMAWPSLFDQNPTPTLIVSNERDASRFDLWGGKQVTFEVDSINNMDDWYARDFSKRTERYGMPEEASSAGQRTSPADAGGLSSSKASTDALSAIHETLGTKATLPGDTYLDDDVQYFDDGPKFKLSNESVVQQATSEQERLSQLSSTLENAPAAKPQDEDTYGLVATAEDGLLNLRGAVSGKEMQDLGMIILKGNKADAEKVESLVQELDRKQAVADNDVASALGLESIAENDKAWMFRGRASGGKQESRTPVEKLSITMPEPRRATGDYWVEEINETEVADRFESMFGEVTTPDNKPMSGLQADDGLALLYENESKSERLSESRKELAAGLNQPPIIEGVIGKVNVAQDGEPQIVAPAVDRFRFELGKQSNTSGSPTTDLFTLNGESANSQHYNFQVVPQAEGVVANSALPQLAVPDSGSTSPVSVDFDFNVQDTFGDPTGVPASGSRQLTFPGGGGAGDLSRPMAADDTVPAFEPPVEGLWLDLAMPKTTIPDGGSVILGGVARPSVTFSSPGDVAAVAVPEMTVTPRIIIGEEEKPLMLGVSPDRALGLFEDGTTRANGQADSPTTAGGMGGGGYGGGGIAAYSVASKDSTVRSIELQRSSPAELLGRLGETLSRGTDVDADAVGLNMPVPEDDFITGATIATMESEPSAHPFAVDASEGDAEKQDAIAFFGLDSSGLAELADGEPPVNVPAGLGTTAIHELQSKSESMHTGDAQILLGDGSARLVPEYSVELGWQGKVLPDIADGRGVADAMGKLPAVKGGQEVDLKRKSHEQAHVEALTTQFDKLMDQGRVAEAQLIAKKAKQLRPDLPEAIIMEEKAKLQQQIALIEEIKGKKADYALDALNKVDLAMGGPTEDYNFPDAKSWSELAARRSKHGSVVGTRGENESTIEKSLGEKTSLQFEETPLTDVVRHIATTHGINIVIDARAIEAKGFTSGRKVSINVDGITLRSALNLLLDQAGGLVYDIENEVLKITNRDGSTKVATSALAKATSVASLNEKVAAEEAFSTFSLHVSDVSFKLALAALAKGEWPEAAKVRIEEFVNAFDYGDPMPANDEKVACAIEQSIHPFVQQRNLLRVSMRTAAAGRASQTPLRLTFVLDNSGSMERIDRQQTVRRAFAMLAQQLTPIDQVTLISFARQPRLLADKVGGADAGKLVGLIDELPSEGGTNIEAALQLAFEKAREQQTSSAQNRIILLTDGAVNLGNANPESLSQMVTAMRNSGIAFDAAGISADGLNDEVLEALARQGDGRYYLLDSLESADDGFAKQIAGALRPSAKNVKVQVEFNPKRVGHYKLLGFEKHILKKEDFRNDKVDAAEMAAAEAGVAMYQFEALPDGEGDVGSVSVRFQDLSTGEMIENRWPIPYQADAARPDQAAASLRIATSAAMLAAKLRGEPLGESVDLQVLSGLMSGLPEQARNDTRVQQLQQMIEQARQLSGK